MEESLGITATIYVPQKNEKMNETSSIFVKCMNVYVCKFYRDLPSLWERAGFMSKSLHLDFLIAFYKNNTDSRAQI